MVDAGFPRAFEQALDRLRHEVDAACAAEEEWPRQVAAAVAVTLRLGAAEPATMRTLTVDAFVQGLPGAMAYRAAATHFAARLRMGRRRCPGAEEMPAVLEEALVGALAGPISEAVRMGREASLPALTPELVEFVLTPYLGASGASGVATCYCQPAG